MFDVITDLPFDDRPRERLFKHGPVTLSDAELLAILLGCGTVGKNAIALGRELLTGGRSALARRDMGQLIRTRGVGPAKAARLLAAFELAHRMLEKDEEEPEKPIFDTEGLGRTLMRTFAPNTQERVGGVFLDSRQRILHQGTIFAGTFDHALVSTREIIQMALNENAINIVLYHNHPSGDPTPSAKDIEFTKKLRDSLQLCDLSLIDHMVVSRTKYVSMRNSGYW